MNVISARTHSEFWASLSYSVRCCFIKLNPKQQQQQNKQKTTGGTRQHTPGIPGLGWNKDSMFEASLGYTERPCFKDKIEKKKQ